MLNRLGLDGKTVIITGGGTGLGLAMVRALARAGANLAIAGRRPGPIDDAASEVVALGRDAIAMPTDVTDSAQVDRLVSATVDYNRSLRTGRRADQQRRRGAGKRQQTLVGYHR